MADAADLAQIEEDLAKRRRPAGAEHDDTRPLTAREADLAQMEADIAAARWRPT